MKKKYIIYGLIGLIIIALLYLWNIEKSYSPILDNPIPPTTAQK